MQKELYNMIWQLWNLVYGSAREDFLRYSPANFRGIMQLIKRISLENPVILGHTQVRLSTSLGEKPFFAIYLRRQSDGHYYTQICFSSESEYTEGKSRCASQARAKEIFERLAKMAQV